MGRPKPETVAAQMQRFYERTYHEILGRMRKASASDDLWRVSRQTQLLKQIAEILDQFKVSSGAYLQGALQGIAEYESQLAVEDLAEFKGALSQSAAFYAEYSTKYVEQVFADTFTHIAAQTDRISQSVKEQLRRDSQEVFRLASVEGIPRRKAYRKLRDKTLGRDPNFQFVDKAGRKWNSKTYLDMMTHTAMATTQRDVYANTLASEGHDLVKIPQNGAQDACRNWEGKILSLTGATKGYPTLAEAQASGEIFHPRCRHRFVAFDAEIDELFENER